MDEKLMALSFSMQSNKGVYALLLGSGISSAAGIPTGWEIVKELCRKMMIVHKENESDPINWYKKNFGKDASYDDVIGRLAKTSSDRNGLLREFFEPSKEDIEQNKKVPTKAHYAIANLVKQGYIRVIVTTNFDQLIEKALDKLQVQYQTFYDESDINGMKPLAHVECTVLKINGDYMDTRFKNVADELEDYPQALTEKLRGIFDEYGLIVSGWSAEWDTALRKIIKSVKGRRYSWYWHLFSAQPNKNAQELINFRDASTIIDKLGADNFFNELWENVDAISKLKKVNPQQLQVKIERFKKYLENKQEIEIRDLISDETMEISQYFNTIDCTKGSELKQNVMEVKEKVRTLAALISILAYNVETSKQEQLLIETLERLTSIRNYDKEKGQYEMTALTILQQLPLQIILYSIGIALVKSRNYKLLNEIFVKPRVRDEAKKTIDFYIFASPYYDGWGSDYTLENLFKEFYSKNATILPMEQFMNNYLQNIMLENKIMYDKEEYNIYYDYFEFLRCIKYYYLRIDKIHSRGKYYPLGIFSFRDNKIYIESFIKDSLKCEDSDVFILCDGSKSKFTWMLKELLKTLDSTSGFSSGNL